MGFSVASPSVGDTPQTIRNRANAGVGSGGGLWVAPPATRHPVGNPPPPAKTCDGRVPWRRAASSPQHPTWPRAHQSEACEEPDRWSPLKLGTSTDTSSHGASFATPAPQALSRYDRRHARAAADGRQLCRPGSAILFTPSPVPRPSFSQDRRRRRRRRRTRPSPPCRPRTGTGACKHC